MPSNRNVILFTFLAFIYSRTLNKPGIPGLTETENFENFTDITKHEKYVSYEHTVTTEDGYIITIFRMGKPVKCEEKPDSQPVLVMHGLFQSSDAWLESGPNSSLVYLLSDECYDVWVGNVRGNYYGRRHLQYNPDKDEKFWQFSADEFGAYDVPAIIDYILNVTETQQLKYIGYSQGGTSFFIMASEKPEYCKKIALMVCMAGATRLKAFKSKTVRLLIESAAKFEKPLNKIGVYEVLPRGSFTQQLGEYFCQMNLELITNGICKNILTLLDSYNPGSISESTVNKLYEHFPAGSSLRNLARFGQNARVGRFQKYDYGKTENFNIYESQIPPEYDLTKVNIPVLIIQGKNDFLVDVSDVEWMSNELPIIKEKYYVQDPRWNHFDMIYSKNFKKYVFPKIIQYL